jgi:FkbM family methyltransferase
MSEIIETINYNNITIQYSYSKKDPSGKGCITEIINNDEYELYKYNNIEGILIDIGGNHGLVTCILAKQNPMAKVIVLEPIPELVNRIKKNVELNNLTNVTIIDKALGDGNNIKLYISNVFSGATSTMVNDINLFKNTYNGVTEIYIESITFDNLLKYYVPEGSDIELLKIDCEGGEYYLYDSLRFKSNVVKNITGEFHNLKYNNKLNPLWNYDDLTKYVKTYVNGDIKISYLTI